MRCISFFLVTFIVGQTLASEYIELNHDLAEDNPVWPSLGMEPLKYTYTHQGPYKNMENSWLEMGSFCTPEHISTHVDAPSHFNEEAWTVDEIPVERLFTPVTLIDVSDKASRDRDYQITAADLENWVARYGQIKNGSAILGYTGWGKKFNNFEEYYGHKTDMSKFTFPGFGSSVAEYIVELREKQNILVFCLGIDTPSIDYGRSKTFPVHTILAKENIYNLEHLTNLDKVSPDEMDIVVMPLKLRGGSGSPSRVLAHPRRSSAISLSAHVYLLSIMLASVFYKSL